MEIIFLDKDLEELILKGTNHKYRKYSKDRKFMEGLARTYRIMQIVPDAKGLQPYSFLHYEQLKNNADLSSVRPVNGRVERILFKEIDEGIEISIIELNNDHYGNKK